MKWPATSGAESLWRVDRGSSPRSTILDFFDSVRTHRRRQPKPPAAEHLPCTDPAVQHQRPPVPPSKKTTHAGQKLPAHTPQTSQRRRNGARNGDEIEGQKAVTWSPPPPRRPRLGTQLSPGQTADEKTKLHACRLRRKGPRRGEEQTGAPLFHSDSASSTTALPPRHLPLNLSTCQQRTGAPPSTRCRSSRRQRRELTTSPALNRGDLNASGFASLSCSKGRGKRNRLSVWLFSQHLFLSFPRARAHPYPSFPFYPRDQPGKNQKPTMSSGPEVVHSGGCHCRRVRWQVEAPASVVAWICNCSDCSMRGNTHFVVPKDKFALQAGAGDFLTTYTFGTHTAKHTFCKVCGITSFYIPRSNPDGVAVTAACVDASTLAHVEYRKADGRNWEQWIEGSGISEFSKPKAAE